MLGEVCAVVCGQVVRGSVTSLWADDSLYSTWRHHAGEWVDVMTGVDCGTWCQRLLMICVC